MAKRYLIDTCAAINYLNETYPEKGISFMDNVLTSESIISFISEIELQVWQPPANNDSKAYHGFIEKSTILSIDDNIIRQTIKIRKKYKIKIPDAIIAATAMVNNYILISDNDRDFIKIYGLQYVNPANIK